MDVRSFLDTTFPKRWVGSYVPNVYWKANTTVKGIHYTFSFGLHQRQSVLKGDSSFEVIRDSLSSANVTSKLITKKTLIEENYFIFHRPD